MKNRIMAVLVASALMLSIGGSTLAAGKMGGAAGGFDPVVGPRAELAKGAKLGIGGGGE